MNAASELVPLDEISADKAPTIYGANILDRYVEVARAEVAGEVADLTTRKGRERVASLAAQVARSKTAVVKPGREYLKRIKELPKAIEVELREFEQQMDALRDEVRAPLNEWQAAEDARVDRHQAVIDELNERGAEAGTFEADYLRKSIALVEQVAINESLEEFEAEAHRAKDKALVALRSALATREAHEAELAAIAKFQAEQAARERQAEIDREAREVIERETVRIQRQAQADADAAAQRERDAKAAADRRELELQLQAEQSARREQEAKQRAEQAERDAADQAAQAKQRQIDADQRAVQAKADAARQQAEAVERAEQAERQRQADEQAQILREAKAREEDKAHKSKINRAALDAFIAGGMPEECAKQAVVLIAKRLIPNVSIKY